MCHGVLSLPPRLLASSSWATHTKSRPLSLKQAAHSSSTLFILSACTQHIHDMAKSMWTPACRTSNSKIMGIHMELVPPLPPQQPPLFWEGFPLDVGTLLQGLASIQPQEVRSGTDVGRLGLVRSQRSNSSQRCSMGLTSGILKI